MNKNLTYLALLLSIVAIFSSYFVNDLGINKIDIAEGIIKEDVRDVIDVWGKRYVVNVQISPDTNLVNTLMTLANGEGIIDNPSLIRETVEPTIITSVKKINWLKNYKVNLTIQ